MKDVAMSERAEVSPAERIPLDSAVLARLMEEVRNGTDRQPAAYNRMHNRHNR